MLVPFFRTLVLYLCIILAVRLMGKRQVGEMQPAELVITILVSAVAAVPMQDLKIPLAHGLIPVFTLIAAEVLISALSLKSVSLRNLLSGKPVPVIRRGQEDQKALRKLRISLDDLLEDLRLSGVFDLRQVAFAQVETNGRLSVLVQAADLPVTARQMGQEARDNGPFYVLVADGRADPRALKALGRGQDWMDSILRANGAETPRQVFLFCADKQGNIIFLKKERQSCDGGY